MSKFLFHMRYHVKLEIHSFVKNFNSGGVFSKSTVYGLGRSLGDCRPALPEGRKCQMVKSQTESHIRRPIVGRSGFSFPLRFAGGRLEFVTQAFGCSLKLSSSGLAFSCSEFKASYTKNFY